MRAFRTMDAGVCAAKCGQPIDVGDLVVIVNDEVVHLECEEPEKAIAAVERMPFDVDAAPDDLGELIRTVHGWCRECKGSGIVGEPGRVDDCPNLDTHRALDVMRRDRRPVARGDVARFFMSTGEGDPFGWADRVLAAFDLREKADRG